MSVDNSETAKRRRFFKGHLYGQYWWVEILVVAALFGLTLSYVATHHAIRTQNETHHDGLAVFLIFAWAAGPPAFFMLEFFLIGRRADDKLPDIEAFKHGQQLASDLWKV